MLQNILLNILQNNGLTILGLLFELFSALYLMEGVTKPPKSVVGESIEESRSFYGANPYRVKKSIETHYRIGISLLLLGAAFILQFMDVFVLSKSNKPNIALLLIIGVIAIILSIIIVWIGNKFVKKSVFNGLIMAFGKQHVNLINDLLNRHELGINTMSLFEGLYGDYIKKDNNENDFGYLKRLHDIISLKFERK